MVILHSKEGQLANRLWQTAYFVANAKEYRYKFVHVGFAQYSQYFKESLNSKLAGSNIKIDSNNFSFSEKLLLKYLSFSLKTEKKLRRKLPFVERIHFQEFSEKRFNLNQPSFIKLTRRSLVSVNGWFYIDEISFRKHADFIRRLLKPNKVFSQNIQQLKKSKFLNYDIIVGVHVRRGDYETYRDGMWYYTDEEYVAFMDKVLSMTFSKNKNVAFLICSNEAIDYQAYKKFNIIKSSNHLVEDLYTLCECNYIIGPPSTYSAWASFYGKVPLLSIPDKNSELNENQFGIFKGWSIEP